MKRHAIALAIGAALAGHIAVAAETEQQTIKYPPTDQPLLLKCWLHGYDDKIPFKEWPSLAIYFANGIGSEPLNPKIVDPHSILENNIFGFNIRTPDHWSIFSSQTPPTVEQTTMMPQIMFLPPTGPANMDIAYIKYGEPVKTGPCVGMIGQNSQSAFEKIVSDPSTLDSAK